MKNNIVFDKSELTLRSVIKGVIRCKARNRQFSLFDELAGGNGI